MELLRNLLWMMLVLLTVLICWRSSRNAGHVGRFHVFVLAACLLALVFPVVSASDDLHALSAEIEESSFSGPSVKQWASSGCPTWSSDVSMPMESVRRALVRPQNEPGGLVLEFPSVFAEQDLARSFGCRAPPAF
jgi:hypothetical protein